MLAEYRAVWYQAGTSTTQSPLRLRLAKQRSAILMKVDYLYIRQHDVFKWTVVQSVNEHRFDSIIGETGNEWDPQICYDRSAKRHTNIAAPVQGMTMSVTPHMIVCCTLCDFCIVCRLRPKRRVPPCFCVQPLASCQWELHHTHPEQNYSGSTSIYSFLRYLQPTEYALQRSLSLLCFI